jgi:hypothetical protein
MKTKTRRIITVWRLPHKKGWVKHEPVQRIVIDKSATPIEIMAAGSTLFDYLSDFVDYTQIKDEEK